MISTFTKLCELPEAKKFLRQEIFAEGIFANHGFKNCEFRGRNSRELKLKGISRRKLFHESRLQEYFPEKVNISKTRGHFFIF